MFMLSLKKKKQKPAVKAAKAAKGTPAHATVLPMIGDAVSRSPETDDHGGGCYLLLSTPTTSGALPSRHLPTVEALNQRRQ